MEMARALRARHGELEGRGGARLQHLAIVRTDLVCGRFGQQLGVGFSFPGAHPHDVFRRRVHEHVAPLLVR